MGLDWKKVVEELERKSMPIGGPIPAAMEYAAMQQDQANDPLMSSHVKEVVIREAENGWIVNVGCKTFVFEHKNRGLLADLLHRFICDKKSLLKSWSKEEFLILHKD